jgi:HK97 family phage major capsid protein
MPYNNAITRTEAQALIPEQVSNEMMVNLANESAALALFRSVDMSTNQTRMPVLAALPVAYFVNGDTGLKQTTEVNWANKFLNVEEIAAIVPIPENVLDDVSFDVWGSVRPLLEQAIGRALDAAIFFGTNAPASWPSSIVAGATAAGNTVTRTTSTQANGGIAQDFNLLMSKVEDDGFDVSGFVGVRRYRGYLRGARDTTGQALADLAGMTIYGTPFRIAMDGQWPTGSGAASLVAGDFRQGIIGKRSDFTYKVLDQAVITDNAGAIIFNLPQQDMIALRVTFRVAFQVANTINYVEAVEANRYPWAVMLEP